MKTCGQWAVHGAKKRRGNSLYGFLSPVHIIYKYSQSDEEMTVRWKVDKKWLPWQCLDTLLLDFAFVFHNCCVVFVCSTNLPFMYLYHSPSNTCHALLVYLFPIINLLLFLFFKKTLKLWLVTHITDNRTGVSMLSEEQYWFTVNQSGVILKTDFVCYVPL